LLPFVIVNEMTLLLNNLLLQVFKNNGLSSDHLENYFSQKLHSSYSVPCIIRCVSRDHIQNSMAVGKITCWTFCEVSDTEFLDLNS
jgi:hypothetical protein